MNSGAELSDLGAAAVDLAENYGFWVHPCRGSRPVLEDWPSSSTTDQDQIERWWYEHPNADIGIVTGMAPGIVVLSVYYRTAFDAWRADSGVEVPETVTALACHEVEHRFFRHPGNAIVDKHTVKTVPGCHIRGDGGNIIVPPGPGRSWVRFLGLPDVELAALPSGILKVSTPCKCPDLNLRAFRGHRGTQPSFRWPVK